MRNFLACWILLVLLTIGCQGFPVTSSSGSVHPLDKLVRIHRSMDGSAGGFNEMVASLRDNQVVFVGETHLDDVTHRVELALLEGLHQSGRSMVVTLEMFGRDRQGILDEYLAGSIGEDAFLAGSEPWNNYETGYRPIIEWARSVGVPVIAANVPRPVWRKVAFGGGLEALDEESRATIAKQLLPNSDRYWQRYDRTVRGHGHAPAGQTPEDRLEKVQSLWDNTMAESVVRALDEYPDALIVHINGGFHTLEGDGVAHQVRLRRKDVEAETIHIIPSLDLDRFDVEKGDRRGDWIVATQPLARGLHADGLAVFMPRPLRYRIDAPARSAGRAPLLIWLAGVDTDAGEVLSAWREELGAEPCIVVVEPIYSGESGPGWIDADHRDEDVATVGFGLQRLREQLLEQRHLQADRVVLSGRGEAADLIASVAIGDPEWQRVVAHIAEGPGWFGMEGLPDPPGADQKHPGPGVLVLVAAQHEEAWQSESVARAMVGAPLIIEEVTDEAAEATLHQRIRTALGL